MRLSELIAIFVPKIPPSLFKKFLPFIYKTDKRAPSFPKVDVKAHRPMSNNIDFAPVLPQRAALKRGRLLRTASLEALIRPNSGARRKETRLPSRKYAIYGQHVGKKVKERV
jgi:hypothetical protein